MAAFLDDFKTYKKAEADEKRRHAAAEAGKREVSHSGEARGREEGLCS